MKKYSILIFIFIIGFFFSGQGVSAIDMCGKKGEYGVLEKYSEKVGFIGKVTQGVNIRDYPCVSSSSVLGTAKVGAQYNVTHKLHGWYGVTLENGQTGRIWDQAIQNTGEAIVTTKVENTLSVQDKVLVSKVTQKIEAIIKAKGTDIKKILLVKLRQVLAKTKSDTRMNLIIQALIENTEAIEIQEEKEEVVVIKAEVVEQEPIEDTTTDENENPQTSGSPYKSLVVYSNSSIIIDESKVRGNWIGWYNNYRQSLGLHNYSYDAKLDVTSLDWSKLAKTRGEISHRRDAGDSYYDYTKIEGWLKDRGVSCKNVSRATYTENIGWGTFSCHDGDCTDELTNGIKKTYDFFLSEKDDDYQPHYKAIVHPYFKKIGLGIVVNETKKDYYNYYLTTHFCTELQ